MEVSSKIEITIADIFRAGISEYCRNHKLSNQQRKVVGHIINCQTPALGRHKVSCTNKDCSYEVIQNNSCRDRHCNKCYKSKKLKWIFSRSKELLPISYYHVITTLPHELCNLAICNKEIIYDIFFKSVFYVINLFASNEKHLGGKVGFYAILHTWGQTLSYHPHLHIIVTAGGLKGDRFVSLPYQNKFLFPVKAMSMKIRERFVELLKEAKASDQLKFPEQLSYLSSEAEFTEYLKEIGRKNWVVYSKPPFSNPETVLDYFSRYTHRVAISNSRILSMEEGKVTFNYKDYKDTDEKGIPKIKQMSLPGGEFVQRFLWHILPKGFRKIRYGGIFSSGIKKSSIKTIREIFEEKLEYIEHKIEGVYEKLRIYVEHICPLCEKGTLLFNYEILINTS